MRRTQNTIREAVSGRWAVRLGLALILACLAAYCWMPAAHAQEGQPAGPASTAGERPGESATHTSQEPEKAEEEPEEGADKIEDPTWITGLLKTQLWFKGPAELTADGAVDASGQPVDPATLKGKQVEYVYTDHHYKGSPKPQYTIHPTIGEVGKSKPGAGQTATIQADGQAITLVNPNVTFALQGMFPENLVISLLTALGLALGGVLLTRNLSRIPNRRQTLVEMIYSFLDDFVHGLIGPTYRRYVPLIGTGFLYILVMNLVGLIPGWKSPTSNVNVTAGLAIVVIVYVQIEGLRVNGLKGYLLHFVGEPWWLAPLNFPLHIIGEFARVLSLSVRLFGNIFGEDVVIAILILLAGMFTKGFIPFQFPMLFLAIFTSIVQAMVFSILAGVYIALMTTHEDHGHEGHGHGDHADHGHGEPGLPHETEVLAPRPAV